MVTGSARRHYGVMINIQQRMCDNANQAATGLQRHRQPCNDSLDKPSTKPMLTLSFAIQQQCAADQAATSQ